MSRRLLAAAALLAAGCTGTDAGLVTIGGDVTGVRQFVIQMRTQNGLHDDSVTAPAAEGAPLTLPKSVSLTFPSTVAGWLVVHVEGKANGVTIGQGDGFSAINHGGVTSISVTLTPGAGATPTDGGAHD